VGGLAAGAASMAVAISGCGAAGPAAPSALDPARMAPAGSLIYVALTARPQGAQRTQVEAALHKLFGKRADAVLQREVDKILRRGGSSYRGGVQKWLGQRIGVVVTQIVPGVSNGLSRTDLALIAPTSDTSAARQFIARALKRSPGATGGIIGNYAVLGGRSAFQAIGAVAKGAPSLAGSASYRTDMAAVGQPEMSAYVNLRGYATAFSRLPQASVLGPLLHQSLSRLSPTAALVMALNLSAHQISVDFDQSGVKHAAGHGAPASVAGLPGSSWLALATGGSAFSAQRQKQLEDGFRIGLAAALTRAGGAGSGAAGLIEQRFGFIEHDVLPALGPLSLSVSGSSPLAIQAGLQLIPGNARAAGRLLAMLHGLAAKSPALQVSGSPTDFSVQVPTGTRLDAAEQSGKVLITYGFPDSAAFLHPTSALASNPIYQQAVSQLPAGSSVPLFLEFAPVASLAQLANHSQSPGAARTMRVLHELRYLIAGGHAGHVRIVLGLN
jgi:hypothetical protein